MGEKSKDFNVYYLNFSKVYEIAMMINNVIIKKIENEKQNSFEEQCGYTASMSAKGSKYFLDGIKSQLSSDAKETSYSSSKAIETLDVKTTKSILLRRIISRCTEITNFKNLNEGDLVKVNNVKLELHDEESLRQFLILRRDAFKGFRVEGIELNNLVNSMLQDYAYVLKGEVCHNEFNDKQLIIKIPMEIKSEFENKYCIDDLLIGHVSVVGIYKGIVNENFISSNTLTYLQEVGIKKNQENEQFSRIIPSSLEEKSVETTKKTDESEYHFIDVLAVIQDVSFNFDDSLVPVLSLTEKIKLFFKNLWRKK